MLDREDDLTGKDDPGRDGPIRVEDLGHPRGTLAIVLIYAALFVLGWLALYFGAFLSRGAPQL